MLTLDTPQFDVGEITLIGTGGGYGESCVIHMGNGEWVVVDSCIDPSTKKCLPLDYLESIDVDIASQVKLIICTHWHDDQILGISQLLHESKNAIFSVGTATDPKKFLFALSLDYQKYTSSISNSSTIEFNKCLEILEGRKGTIRKAVKDKTLYISPSGVSAIISLSPSDFTVSNFDAEISTLITDFGETNKKITVTTPNNKSVALFLRLGNHRAILGADLEVSRDDREGWVNILNERGMMDKNATLFKIPHHGSENGYHERIWLELLEPSCVAKLTPWNKNSRLPEVKMLGKFLEHTQSLYMTSKVISSKKPKKREKNLEKMISFFNPTLEEVKYQKGIIRCRIPLHIETNWTVNTFESAFQVPSL